jgi:trehalose-6-phosphate synthase
MTHSARCDIAASVASARVGRYGEAFWTPIRYVNRFHSRTALARIYRSADVTLVRPLRDGMSLVAKEYVAAQDAVNPGVLILSQFAGAAAELTGALIANPHERDAVAATLIVGAAALGRGYQRLGLQMVGRIGTFRVFRRLTAFGNFGADGAQS